MPSLHIGIPCANTRRRTESRRGGAGASGFVFERTSRIVRADAIDLPVALRVFPHRLCVVEPRRHEPFEVLHGDAVEAAHLVQAAEDLRPHKLCSHPVIRSIKISVRCGGSHATPNGQVSLAVDWLPKNHVRLHHQDVVRYGRRRVLEQPVVKGTRLVVRCIVVLHEVVLGATIVRMHVGRADVQTGVSLRVITSHEPCDVAWLLNLIVRIEHRHRLPGATGATTDQQLSTGQKGACEVCGLDLVCTPVKIARAFG